MEVPLVPPSSQIVFAMRTRTRWSDEDNQSVLNNAVYLTLLEEARYAYFSSLDLLEHNRFPFLLAQTNVRFLKPGRGGVEVEIELATVELGRTSFEQAYRVRELDTKEIWCEARARLVCVDAATGRKAPMSEPFKAAIRAREGALLDRERA